MTPLNAFSVALSCTIEQLWYFSVLWYELHWMALRLPRAPMYLLRNSRLSKTVAWTHSGSSRAPRHFQWLLPQRVFLASKWISSHQSSGHLAPQSVAGWKNQFLWFQTEKHWMQHCCHSTDCYFRQQHSYQCLDSLSKGWHLLLIFWERNIV